MAQRALSQTAAPLAKLEQPTVNKTFRGLKELFARVQYLHIVPQLVHEPPRSVGKVPDPFGGDYLDQVARTQKKVLDCMLGRIQDALRVKGPPAEGAEA